ncbi:MULTISPECIES: stalk domain-containing protein [Peptostreptococcus]|uniref:stalk domain-containing protein n=1 Tax=Peptostreptococcus TaxID=1257 RepID=UPI0007677FFF|nr:MULTISPECIES: stalk domain-containing protein [Peptostreptococcus]KXB73061.1 copper amine oxidase domain protein [Peptostreptococcus anaerobius]MDU1264572.1 stalk domain-containing protein [Peptostreptococcus sp.]MDU1598306.1 stalk domain-containing protein [Peptostreptococcus anaerobius]MDU1681841.1 stalk domain-containing protein [Peptostreptococcus anaerobius]
MLENIDRKRAKIWIKMAIIILATLVLILSLFRLFLYNSNQRKLISEFKNTKIREKLIINNKKAKMDKPYKIRDGIVYVPVLELCKNFNSKTSYKLESKGGIEFSYNNDVYKLARGSNEVRFKENKDILKMDGIVQYMEDTIYVPLDFIYKVLDVNVVQASDGTVYMDNYPKKFNYEWVKENRYIAHAMGGIGGNTYTNSKEAMENSYKRGIRVMEADFSLSSDDKLILCHSFDTSSLSSLGLPLSWNKEKPSEREFLSKKILGTYHTMNFEDVAKYMKAHKDMYLVVDLKTNDIKSVEKSYRELVRVAKKVDPDIMKRVIPQIYYEEMYRPLMNIYNFKSMIFTTYRLEELKAQKIVDFSYEHGIKIVAVNKFKFSNVLTNKLLDRGISLYMFTYNDEKIVNTLRNNYVSGFYTDFLPKDEIKRDDEGRVIIEKKNTEQEGQNPNQDSQSPGTNGQTNDPNAANSSQVGQGTGKTSEEIETNNRTSNDENLGSVN